MPSYSLQHSYPAVTIGPVCSWKTCLLTFKIGITSSLCFWNICIMPQKLGLPCLLPPVHDLLEPIAGGWRCLLSSSGAGRALAQLASCPPSPGMVFFVRGVFGNCDHIMPTFQRESTGQIGQGRKLRDGNVPVSLVSYDRTHRRLASNWTKSR